MVSDRDRAQLILIGAIMIATIIFGLSVLLNSLVFTGATGVTSADASLSETDLADFEIQRNVRAVVVRVNHADRSATWNELETRIEENVTRFSRLLAESKAASSSVAVNVSYDNSTSEGGWRIVQAEDADFSHPGGNPVPATADATVGWFTANVHVGNTTAVDGDRFTVVAEEIDPPHREVTIDIWESSSGSLTVESTYDGTTNSTTCGSTGGRVLLDLYQGSGFVDGCEFNGTARLDGPVTVEFERANRIQGKYSIVVDERGSIPYPECTTVGGNDACLSPVIWSANLTTTVHGDGISYESAYNLSLYTEP